IQPAPKCRTGLTDAFRPGLRALRSKRAWCGERTEERCQEKTAPLHTSFTSMVRNRERERRARTHLALDPDPSAMQLDELPRQGNPEPRALHLLGSRPHC